MKFKKLGSSSDIPVLNTILRLLALLACLLAGSYSWAQSAPSWSSIGPAGGTTTTLLPDPLAPKTTLYAGSDVNGVFLSSDAGATWRSANTGIQVNLNGQRQIYAMASLGNYIYAATDTGVYVAVAGGTASWALMSRPAALASTSVITLLASANSTLYMAATAESNVYATNAGGSVNPTWITLPLPLGAAVTALGVLNGRIATGSVGAVYLFDTTTSTWNNSEDTSDVNVLTGFGGGYIAAFASSSNWAFVCTTEGKLFQADLSAGLLWTWAEFTDFNAVIAPPSSCFSLTIARVSGSTQSVLAMATASGAFVSTMFDATSSIAAPKMLPGPVFQMATIVNTSLQLDPAGSSNLLWATDFGIYGSSAADLSVVTQLPISTPAVLNGPAILTTPSQRLDNVNVRDVAAIGTTKYAIAQSNSVSYQDVMRSNDGGKNWTPTNLAVQLGAEKITSLAADTIHNVLYAGSSKGVFYLQQGVDTSWTLLASYNVKTLAVSAQALYSIRKESGTDGVLIIQSLIGGTAFTAIENPITPFVSFDVRTLLVSGGSIYVGGDAVNAADALKYDNAVWVTADVVPTTLAWSNFGASSFQNSSKLSSLSVGAGHVFAGGDGFLMRCESAAGSWGSVPGLPVLNLEPVGVTALASDSQTLYVGTAGAGLYALALSSNTASLVSINGTGTAGLPSSVVNGLRVIDGRLYVATAAGVSTPVDAVPASTGGAGGGSGGCSMSTAGEPDPLLWLLIGIAALQIAYARRRRGMRATSFRPDSQNKSKDR